MLEYDLARAISSVHGGKAEENCRDDQPGNWRRLWREFSSSPEATLDVFRTARKRLRDGGGSINMASEIPEGTTTLIVLAPLSILPTKRSSPLISILLGGGNVMVFVDPNFFYARALAQGPPQMPGNASTGWACLPRQTFLSSLTHWGVKYDANRVLADLGFGSEIIRRGNFSPTFLTLNRGALG